MKMWERRLQLEAAELRSKIRLLKLFIENGNAKQLSLVYNHLLAKQLEAMNMYSDILDRRIARIKT